MMAEANAVAEGLVTGSIQAKLHMPHAPMRYAFEPLKPACFPATYASKWITKNGASMGKL